MAETIAVADADGNVQQVPVEPVRFAPGDNQARRDLLRSENTKETARHFMAEMVHSFISDPHATPTQVENGLEVLGQAAEQEGVGLTSQPAPAAPAPAEVAPPVAEAPAEPVVDPWAFNESPELAALAAEEPEPEPAPVAQVEVPEADEYEDDTTRQLREALAAEKRRAEHERKLRVQASKPAWIADAVEAYKFVTAEELAAIDTDSHRDFIRQAKAKAEANREVLKRHGVAPAAAPAAQPGPEVVTQADLERIRAEARAEAAAAWGKPTVENNTTAPADSAARQTRIEKARRTGSLSKVLKATIFD